MVTFSLVKNKHGSVRAWCWGQNCEGACVGLDLRDQAGSCFGGRFPSYLGSIAVAYWSQVSGQQRLPQRHRQHRFVVVVLAMAWVWVRGSGMATSARGSSSFLGGKSRVGKDEGGGSGPRRGQAGEVVLGVGDEPTLQLGREVSAFCFERGRF